MTDHQTESADQPTASRGQAETGPGSIHRIERVVERELRTLARTSTFAILAVAFAAVVFGIGIVGGGVRAGYVPTAVDLVTPLELLVPVVAIAFGYRAIVGDGQRGELDVLETYPLAARELVVGVFVGRALGLLAAVGIPVSLAGAAVVFLREEPLGRYASHVGADSPLLFVRFVVLTVLFALVVLAVAIAISALVSGTREALALAVVALVVLLVGIDLALVYGVGTGIIGESALVYSLAVSPLSAYRGLVFETVVVTAAGTGPRTASPAASLFGLAAWTVGSLLVATWAVKR